MESILTWQSKEKYFNKIPSFKKSLLISNNRSIKPDSPKTIFNLLKLSEELAEYPW